MPRPHAPFCDLPAGPDHGPFCVSRPVARETVAVTETGERVDVTTDLAVLRTEAGAVASVRVVAEPPEVTGRLVALLSSGAARQLSAALTVAADQADELDRNVRAAMGGHA